MPELEHPSESRDRPDPADDPISRLHKMSTTAGVGSQDYVAINNAAIISVILGLCTFLAFLGLPFLIIGAAGIVFGIIALIQIRHSNGTQGGAGIAVIGILLSLAIAGTVAAGHTMAWMRQRDDERAIDALFEQLGQHIAANNYDRGRQLFSPDFQAAWPPDLFRSHLQSIENYLGKIEGMSSNDVFKFETTPEGIMLAQTQAILRFRTPATQPTTQPATAPTNLSPPGTLESRRAPAGLYKISGQWRIAAMEIFRKTGQ